MTTVARTHTSNGAHWYLPNGDPFYEVQYADPKKGMRSATLADARKVGALPSVTNVLNVLDKPALTSWKVEQGVLAVLTTPRLPDEADDSFVHRVLHVEKVQEQESSKAKDTGTALHDAIEKYFTGQDVPAEHRPWIQPAIDSMCKYGELVCAEKVLVGDGYAGRTDLILEAKDAFIIWDAKTTRKLPKTAYTEAVMQLSAYASAFHRMKENVYGMMDKPIRTANVYISTVEVGNFVICEHDPDWQKAYNSGFVPALKLWQFINNYAPKQ